jgi:hypothetical protein
MPILVVCPACKSEFNVSDKFAGKKGPCPKCKAPITIPTPKPAEAEVKVHAPDEAETKGKTKTGRMSVKPIQRTETTLRTVPALAGAAAIIALAAGAWFLSGLVQQNLLVRGVGLLLISVPTIMAGYSFLRNDELEPYRGAALWIRSLVCAVIYVGLWIGFYFVPPDLLSSALNWVAIAPPFAVVGALTAMFCFDLDFGSGFFHYCFYLLVTLGFGALSGLTMPWSGVTL